MCRITAEADTSVRSNELLRGLVVHVSLAAHAGMPMASLHQPAVELHPKHKTVAWFCGLQMLAFDN